MATKFISGFYPQYKLHKVCANDLLRPVMGYLYFKNGKVYATNAHIAIAAPLSFVSSFSDEEQKLLDGKLIHATHFAELLKMRETKLGLVGENLCFICTTKNGLTVTIPILDEDTKGKFPNVDVVLESARADAKKHEQPVSHVGLKMSLLADLAAAMGASNVDLYFSSAKAAIVVEDGHGDNEIGAIIMPRPVEYPKY